jgi:membrane protease YdiL (CAAX protease family)
VKKENIMNAVRNNSIGEATTSKNVAQSDGLWAFFGLIYILTFFSWGLLAIFQLPVASSTNTTGQTSVLAMLAYLFVGGFAPTTAGLIMTYRVEGRTGLRQLWKRFINIKLGGKWYLVIITVPLINFVISSLVHKMQGGNFVSPDFGEFSAGLIPLVITVFLFGPVSEEIGWRGFALERVQARWGAVKGSLVLGLIWSFWHLPLFFIPGSGQQLTGDPGIMFPVYSGAVLGMTFIITWVYNNTNQSVWGANFFHFTLNFGTVMLIMFSDATDAFAYKAMAVNYILMAVILVVVTRGQLHPTE